MNNSSIINKRLRILLGSLSIILTIGMILSYLFSLNGEIVRLLFGGIGGGLLAMPLPTGTGTIPPTGTPTDPTTQTVEKTVSDPDTEELDQWDVDKKVLWKKADNAPLNCLTRRIRKTKNINSQVFKFWTSTQNDGIYETKAASGSNTVITAKGAEAGGFDLPLAVSASDLLKDDVLGMVIDDTTKSLGYSWDEKGSLVSQSPLVPVIIQIVGKVDNSNYKAIVVNDKGGVNDTISIPMGSTFFRIGNAKDELDVMNDAFNLMPRIDANFAQRFMKVVSESDYQSRIGKEATWGLEDYKRACMYAFIHEIELSMFVGQRRTVRPYTDKGEVYYTGGFDDFLKGNVINHVLSSLTNLKLTDLQDWGRRVFTTTNGSAERYMFVSPLFMQRILAIPELMSANNTILRATDAMDLEGHKLGFSLRKLDTGYGIINLVMHKGLAGRRDYRGYIIDLENIQRCILDPAQTKKVDLEEKLIKKANAYIIEECSGLKIQNIDSMALVDLKVA